MLPTPPAPPTMSRLPRVIWSRGMRNRSNSISQAVSAVSGRAAAAAKPMDFGLWPTILSSTKWNSALLPGRVGIPT